MTAPLIVAALMLAGAMAWMVAVSLRPGPLPHLADTIRGDHVRPGHRIGLGPGLALRVERVVFDGPDGMLVGRADCDGPIDNGRHGVLRPGQPYAAVVTADGELSWLPG